jgi:hypothetical protein
VYKAALEDFDLSTLRATMTPANGLLVTMLKRGTSELHFFLVDTSGPTCRVNMPFDPVFCFNEPQGEQKTLLNYELVQSKGKHRAVLLFQVQQKELDKNTIILELLDVDHMESIVTATIEFDIAFLGQPNKPVALITYSQGSREEHCNYSVMVSDSRFKLFMLLEEHEKLTCRAKLERASEDIDRSNNSKTESISHRLKVIDGKFIEERSNGEFKHYRFRL